MTLTAGDCLGPYEIVALVGAGGMGEVYRARDTRLDRDVAVKVLPSGTAVSPTQRARFDREARAISQLNHPNICILHDVGETNGVSYLVMEFIEGESLEARLRSGPVPWTTAVEWAIQIVNGLDAAHRRGIVHRDLKPANVMLTGSGVKLLDFGIAKLIDGPTAEGSLASPTTLDLTAEQTMIGTLHYMAPEQLECGDVDARTDIFAFGTILYEMLSGRKAFDGPSRASVSAAILTADPAPLSTTGPVRLAAVPPALEHVIGRAIAKRPDDRWQSARDLMHELQWIQEARSRQLTATASGAVPVHRRARLVAGAVALTAIGAAIGSRYPSAPVSRASEPMTQFAITAPAGTRIHRGYGIIAVAPDGRAIAFLAGPDAGPFRIWIRELGSIAPRPLTGTEDAQELFWSPDSRSVGFSANGNLQRVDIHSGRPVVIAALPSSGWLGPAGPPHAAWVTDDTILVSNRKQLFRVPVKGGRLSPFLAVNDGRGDIGFSLPSALSNGRFFYRAGDSVNYEVRVGSLERPILATLPVETNIAAAEDHVIFRRDSTLYAQPFDDRDLRLMGHPTTLVENIQYNPGNGRTAFSVGGETLAFRSQVAGTLRWKDRSGRPAASVGSTGRDWNPALAPDGSRRIAVDRHEPDGNRFVVSIIDEQGRVSALSQNPRARFAVWSPDGKWIAYSVVATEPELRRARADGSGAEEAVSSKLCRPLDWSRDGRFLLCNSASPADLWVIPMDGADHSPRQVTATAAVETTARFSPDGRWIAYSSDEGGQPDIWIQSFPDGGAKRKISTTGGLDPSWRADQKELFYMALDGTLMAVPVAADRELTFGDPVALFRTDVGPIRVHAHPYAADPTGRRFLVNEFSGGLDSITVIRHWMAMVRQH